MSNWSWNICRFNLWSSAMKWNERYGVGLRTIIFGHQGLNVPKNTIIEQEEDWFIIDAKLFVKRTNFRYGTEGLWRKRKWEMSWKTRCLRFGKSWYPWPMTKPFIPTNPTSSLWDILKIDFNMTHPLDRNISFSNTCCICYSILFHSMQFPGLRGLVNSASVIFKYGS